VPSDIVRVRASDHPADALVLEATAFTAGEAATGDYRSKRPGLVARNAGEPAYCSGAP
jgi:hypothetical protein